MKPTLILLILFTLTACNDSQRRRLSDNCTNTEGKTVACVQNEELNAEYGFKSKFITSVSIPISVSETRITFEDSATDNDVDDLTFICSLDVGIGTSFTYNIENNLLVLKNGLTVLKFKKVIGRSSDNLIGKWSLTEKVSNKIQTITEFIINDLENLRITKTCNVK